MKRIACMMVMLMSAGPVLAQHTILYDAFDGYGSDGYLSVVSNPVWTVDACWDALLVGWTEPPPPCTWWTAPYSSRQYKEPTYGKLIGVRNKHVFTAAKIQSIPDAEENANCIRGTNDDPLRLVYYLHCKVQTMDYAWENRFVEVVCGDDRAPTAMLKSVCPPDDKVRYHLDNVSNDANANEAPVHSSIAIGAVAMADMDPCDPELRQEVYRLVVYDGQYWRILKDYPTTGTNLHLCYKWNWIELRIGCSTIEVILKNKYDPTAPEDAPVTQVCGLGNMATEMTTTIPRKYLGAFTAVVMGGLIMEDPEDPPEGWRPEGNCWGERSGGGINNAVSYIDNLYVQGGVGKYLEDPCPDNPPPPSACCRTDGSCEDNVEEANCQPPDVWREGENCGECLCCPKPWADSDGDLDVDQLDFGVWQACFTGAGGGVNPGCECYDRDDSTSAQGGDDDVDATDYQWFVKCFTGPAVPMELGDPPTDCVP